MKHINITNFEGSITDWTKLNYIAGGMEDDVASLANQTGNKLSKDENGDWQIKDSNGNVIWPTPTPSVFEYKFEDITQAQQITDSTNYTQINSFFWVKGASGSYTTALTNNYSNTEYDDKYRLFSPKGTEFKVHVENCTEFYMIGHSSASSGTDRNYTITDGTKTETVIIGGTYQNPKTATFIPSSTFTGDLIITAGGRGYIDEFGYTKE